MLKGLLFAACFLLATSNAAAAQPKIVTSDIANFWRAFDAAQRSKSPDRAYATYYFEPGSKGLWGFVPNRLVSPWHLAAVAAKYRAYYEAARDQMERIPAQRAEILTDFDRYKKLYPEADFPDVYFVVGALNSGGTSVPGVGLVIGAEMVSRPPQLTAKMPGFNTAMLNVTDRIPALVVHEATHYNQHDADADSLLGATLNEGTADFMSQLVTGKNADPAQWSFGCAHEDALWAQFATQTNAQSDAAIEPWLYSYKPGPLGAPPFIGYWLGSRIVQTYYDAAPDKRAALHAIMHITDFNQFLKQSGYPQKRSACVPEKQAA